MQDTVFREYDIRGIVDSELILSDMYQLGRAIFAYCLDQKASKTVLIGQDGRVSSPVIAQYIVNAALDTGLDVVNIGVVPSPVMYFGMHKNKGDIGIMITASHNPGHYNGIKIMVGQRCVWGQEIQAIKTYFYAHKKISIGMNGTVKNDSESVTEYVAYLVDHFPLLHSSTLSMIFDCGNAVAGAVMPLLITQFNWPHARLLYQEIDGTFPVHEADPTVEKNMRQLKAALLEDKASVGIGFDGDADRMAAISEEGKLFLGDTLLAIFAAALPNDSGRQGVVFNVTMSNALQLLFNTHQIPFFLAPTGHAVIKEYMSKHGAVLAGEGSCHFFFADRYFGYDDGIYAALRLIEIMVTSKKTLTELASVLPKQCTSREYRIACADDQKRIVIEKVKDALLKKGDAQLLTIDGVRAEFSFGWGIVRAANTQPVISMRFESATEEGLFKVKKEFEVVLRPYLNDSINIIFEDC